MCTEKPPRPFPCRQGGLSLLELVVFIVIVGVALTGILAALNQTVRVSADPMLTKQALAIAEALLEEVQLQPFTYCDPDDANSATARAAVIGANGCQATLEIQGREGGETRFSTTEPFDNVSDYHGFAMNAGIRDITGTALAGLGGFSASVAVAPAALHDIEAGTGDALRITVTVTGPGNTIIVLDGYRSRYAPNI